ncbi:MULTISPECIES: phosphate ABC transporter substrate-binding protein PstS [Microbacterium]|uniref:Phosphate-binding protein n=1 Tax=Microbacterium paraoxydans TaxID=199592 RepID=A0ABZ2HQY0_9MICO|nr:MULTISPECIES: phosphate ABC transporter substrate-binding protein PstS [Microbacterium]KYJ97563.1 phosphate ABC transporter substrate-binding protein [Microbacterium sp. CH1]MCT1396324.1 phosphate ABC transporter substrate-binding protein PstS [Microbacterium sp. p3-SID338]PMC04102.1 phosphate ABC transporter substrate-binding protein PstS [Microbacterium sp. UMB0228]
MKISRIARIGAIGAVAALALAGCAANEGGAGGSSEEPSESTLSGTIDATGASSQTAAQEAWVAAFQTANPDVTVNYEPTGSGTGRENFLEGGSNFIGSDRAFNDEEIAAGGFGACTTDDIVEVPLYISPVAVAFNLEGIDTLNLDAATIAGIFAGTITNWNDEAIAALNDGVELPDLAISPVHRSDPSGTQETFAKYLSATAPDVWTYEVSDEWPIQGGEAAQGTSGVKQALTAGNGAIGFLDASQADGLGQVAVGVGEDFVSYSAEAAAKLVEGSPLAEGRGEGDLVFDVDPAAAADGAYPIALVSYLIGCEQYEDSNVAELVKEYFTYIASAEGQDAAAENAGSAPISDGLREQVQAAIDLIQVG